MKFLYYTPVHVTKGRYVSLNGAEIVSEKAFSPAVLKALIDVVTGGAGNDPVTPIGIYRSASKIEQLMLDCDLDFQLGGGSRLPMLTAYLRELMSEPGGAEKIKRVILRVAQPDDYGTDLNRQQAVISHLNRVLERDGYEVVLYGHQPQLVARGKSGVVVGAIAGRIQIP
jgi:hypothetical protein